MRSFACIVIYNSPCCSIGLDQLWLDSFHINICITWHQQDSCEQRVIPIKYVFCLFTWKRWNVAFRDTLFKTMVMNDTIISLFFDFFWHYGVVVRVLLNTLSAPSASNPDLYNCNSVITLSSSLLLFRNSLVSCKYLTKEIFGTLM